MLTALLALTLGLAQAQDGPPPPPAPASVPAAPDAPADDEPAPPDNDEPIEEVNIYGEVLINRARRQVVNEVVEQGYTRVIDKGDHVIYRHEQIWKGDVVLYDEGYIRIKRQPVQVHPPTSDTAKDAKPLSWGWCLLIYPCIHYKGQTVSTRKLMAQKVRALETIQPRVDAWGDRIADQEIDRTLRGLPDRLLDLWEHGTALDGGPTIEGAEARRAALLDYWETRTDNPWGDAVRVGVEAFLREEVQNSATPFTAEEIAAVNARRHCARALDLDSPWEEVAPVEVPQ